jgi:hypothetical protein
MRYAVSAWNSSGLLSRIEQHAFLARNGGKHGSRNTGRRKDRSWHFVPIVA